MTAQEQATPAMTTAAEIDLVKLAQQWVDADTLYENLTFTGTEAEMSEAAKKCNVAESAFFAAALALADFIGQHTVTCQAKKRDRYGRWLARCSANNEDLSIWLAWNGWAMAYRDCKCEDIRDATGRAASKQIGIWATTFIEPWRWRRGER